MKEINSFAALFKDRYLANTIVAVIFIFSLTILPYFLFTNGTVLRALIGMFLGFIFWTLFEYVINKNILHTINRSNGLLKSIITFHENHHKYPAETKYISMHPVIILAMIIIEALVGVRISNWIFLPFIAGFIFGYGYFIVLHYAQHHLVLNPKSIYFNNWKRHFLHHKHYPNKALGVSTSLWDIIFKTEPPSHLFAIIEPATLLKKSEYRLEEVVTSEQENLFLTLPSILYANDPNWISPLKLDIKKIFDPQHNIYFKRGVAKRWIILNESNEVMGRIAAFIDFNKMYDGTSKIGRIGFFESVNDIAIANQLFETSTNWLKENFQVDEIEGPVNFGENDKYWGLLIEGFSTPSYGMNYNPPYYKIFFEQFGFVKQYEQLTNIVDLRKNLPDRFAKIANRVCFNRRYQFTHFKESNKSKFIKDFVEIYNDAWKDFHQFQPLSEQYIEASFNDLRPVLVEQFIWFAYVEGEPAGLMVAVPDVNQALRFMHGEISFGNKLKFWFYKSLIGFSKVRIIIMGIKPQFQRLGLESGLILNAFEAGKKVRGYKSVQLAWVGDFNTKMIAIHNAMNATPETKHATYRIKLS